MLDTLKIGDPVWIKYRPFAIISYFTRAEVVRITPAAVHVRLPLGTVERYSKRDGYKLPDRHGQIVPEEPQETKILRPTYHWRRLRDKERGNE